jgi:hypothetical protein
VEVRIEERIALEVEGQFLIRRRQPCKLETHDELGEDDTERWQGASVKYGMNLSVTIWT